MKILNRILWKLVLLPLLCCVSAAGWAASQPESKTVAQARELVDTYYGNQANLIGAARLLELAHQADPRDAHVFVQAARITVMGGYLSFGNYESGTFERYGALLDKAIALDGTNAKAHILKAQVFANQKRYREQLQELDKAKALETTDPWLLIGYASYYKNIGSGPDAYDFYSQVERRGPGATASERKAYVSALAALSGMLEPAEKREDKLRKYAALALKERYPTDAWTPHGYAEDFLDYHLFDDAIVYAREALKTMDYGAGRRTLAGALYAKAAQLVLDGRPLKESKPYIDEAETFGFSKAAVIEYLVQRRGIGGSLDVLTSTLDKIIR